MANEITAVFNQGVLEMQGDRAKVGFHFTAPANSPDVTIEFYEVDSWVSDGRTVKESDKPDRLLGRTAGVIAGTKYRETAQLIPFPVDGAKQLLTVDIDGSLITMPLPNPNHDVELDFYEVSFAVFGTVNGLRFVYRSPSPLFVRNTPTPRAELAIIAGDGKEFLDDPSTTHYFVIAAQYWTRLQDNRRTPQLSLQSTFFFLKEDTESALRARNSLPWGRINIVSHGDDGWNSQTATFEGVWYIRARDGDDISDSFGFTASELKDADPGTGGPRRREVDEHTEIIIRGCVMGNDVSMLNAIRDKFGGLATVFAPKFSNSYRIEAGGVPRDRLFDCWTVSFPGDTAFPDRAHLAALLKARYRKHPQYASFSDSDWNAVAGITEPLRDGASQFRQRIVDKSGEQSADCDEDEVKKTVAVRNRTGKIVTVKQMKDQAELTTLMRARVKISNSEFDRWTWHWKVTPPPTEDAHYLVAGIGTRTNGEIFRILTTQVGGKAVPVTPDHKNPAQFGRST